MNRTHEQLGPRARQNGRFANRPYQDNASESRPVGAVLNRPFWAATWAGS